MSVRIELERRAHRPGDVVRGQVVLDPPADGRTELSVLWETSGKGTSDLGVLHHEVLPAGGEHAFEVSLPLLPLSYDGTLIKVTWLVRVRRLVTLGEDLVTDDVFTVGW